MVTASEHSATASASVRRELSGRFTPAPRSPRLAVERLVGRQWRRIGSSATGRDGRYRVPLSRAGTYRVRAGSVAGPSVRVG
jgi:hypothetical protein